MTLGNLKVAPFICIITISVLGFITGVICIALWQENWLLKENVLNMEAIHDMQHIYMDKRALFFLCLGKRLRAFFVLVFMSFTSMNFCSVLFYYCFRGFAVGSVVELLLIQYGMQGGLLYLSCVLPQAVLYVPGYMCVGCWCLQQKANAKRQGISRLMIAFILILLGIIMESFWEQKFFFMFFGV